MKLLLFILISFFVFKSNGQISNSGHPEHLIGGFVIGGLTSYLIFKKTDNKLKSWLIGTGAATAAGLIKEAIDPALGREQSGQDLGYTILGGVIGSSIVIPLKKKTPKEITYLF